MWVLKEETWIQSRELAGTRAAHLGPRGCHEETLFLQPKAKPKPQASGNRIKSSTWLPALSRNSSSLEQPYLACCDSGYRSGPAPSTSKPGGGEMQQRHKLLSRPGGYLSLGNLGMSGIPK